MRKNKLRVLALGDIIGDPGRRAILTELKILINKNKIDFVIVNGENAAGGFGINKYIAAKLLESGVDVITSGNHIWRQKDIYDFLEKENRILRPANYPKGALGLGAELYHKDNVKIGVINILGRIFMEAIDCPFAVVEKAVEKLNKKTPIIIVDFHAEATSEKMAMGWFLDGKASMVYGTHTHVQTADERILEKGTAYITDIGMVGPWDSVIGMEKTKIINKFLSALPEKYEVATDNVHIEGIIVDINIETGKAEKISRLQYKVEV